MEFLTEITHAVRKPIVRDFYPVCTVLKRVVELSVIAIDREHICSEPFRKLDSIQAQAAAAKYRDPLTGDHTRTTQRTICGNPGAHHWRR
jgi:hypothetical protein